MKRFARYRFLLLLLGLFGFSLMFFDFSAFAQEEVRLDLIPPTEIAGYASGLQVGGGDLTTLVVLITNYVLGFLGLISLTAIIYAGMLYVANFGNDEMTAKAKNIIIYVSIGSLVIILSYAIVNAIFGVTGSGVSGGGSGPGGSSPGKISPGDFPVITLDSLFDVKGKDYILPLQKSVRDLGDLCPGTPIGLIVSESGCAQNEILPDTDGDGTANVLDKDDDGDGTPDGPDADSDGDSVCSSGKTSSKGASECSGGTSDFCPDTLNFVVFKLRRIEEDKLQVDRADKAGYEKFIAEHQGCGEYEQKSDIDGDSVLDQDDCDADSDGLLDNPKCLQDFNKEFSRNNTFSDGLFRGAVVTTVIRDQIDPDTDNDGIQNFGATLQPEARDLLLQEVVNNFASLENFIRLTCATLPQTRQVLDYCGYENRSGAQVPVGKIVRILEGIRSSLSLADLENFAKVYDEFLAIVKTFPRIKAVIKTPNNVFEDFLPSEGTAFKMSFDATDSVDPYQQFCSVSESNYLWFINKDIDFSKGLSGLFNSQSNPPDGTGVFFTKEFTIPGVFNIQLLVKSACKFNIVNPGANESADVDAAVAGLTSLRINIFPPKARLVVKVNEQPDPGPGLPIAIPSGPSTPVKFDLRESVNRRGSFTKLVYDCGNGTLQEIPSGPPSWTFSCIYPEATGTRTVTLRARDNQGEISRSLIINFKEVVADFVIRPGNVGKTSTEFTFDATSSKSSFQIKNFTFKLTKKNDQNFKQEFQQAVVTFRFPSPGEYELTLEVSTGGGTNQIDTVKKTITVEEQEPVAAFRTTFPEKIRPARALLDGSLSFHPDFPNGANFGFLWDVDGIRLQLRSQISTSALVYDQVVSGKDDKIFFEFPTIGEHQVSLTVIKGSAKDTVTDKVAVKTLLGIDFTIDRPAARVNDVITFTPISDKALGFFWDFADGTTQVSSRNPGFSSPQGEPVKHKYSQQGSYKVKLTVEDGSNNTNTIEKIVRIGIQNAPQAFPQIFINGIEQNITEDCLEITRRDSILFDAGKSLSVKGDNNGISYLWETEDIEDVIRQRTFSKFYKELTEGCFEIKLTVTDLSTNTNSVATPILLKVINMPPEVTDIRFLALEQQIVTPLTVNVSALGPRDIDGRVVRYYWYYFEEGNPKKKLDPRVTDIPRTTFVIGPNASEGSKSTYSFVVELEDNDGSKMSSRELTVAGTPLTVINGANVAPKAEFIADKTSAKIGDIITFTSNTKDPLGEYLPSAAFQWDLDGDAEFDRGVSGPKITFRYLKAGEHRVILKVTKNGLSSQYDMVVRIIPNTKKPEAAFIFVASGSKVKFITNSSVDPALESKDLRHEWDFDSSVDSDGNGIPDDDVDSADLSPSHEYKGDKDVSAALRVIDSVGNTARVLRKIPFVLGEAFGALGVKKEIKLKAVLLTNPAPHELDSKIYLTPPISDVVFTMKKSIGRIQEYRLDANIFVDSDGDGVADNDVDNKTHKSWKDGSPFKVTYRQTGEKLRAKLTIVTPESYQKSQVIDIVFQEEKPKESLNKIEKPEDIEKLFQNRPVISFDVSDSFGKPKEKISFDARKTRFPDEKIKEYRWDFDGDGLVDEISFDPKISYGYEKPGAYEVVLEAVSEQGLQGEYSQTVFVRGGLQLPEAHFTFQVNHNEVSFENTSSVDPSMKEEEIRFEWSFARVDLGDTLPWASHERQDQFVATPGPSDESPLWVQEQIQFPREALGLLPRESILGKDKIFFRFDRGTTFVSDAGTPYDGDVAFRFEENPPSLFSVKLSAGKTVTLSSPAKLIVQGVVESPILRIAGQEPISGTVEDNQTIFVLPTLFPAYEISGTLQASGDAGDNIIGSDSGKNPTKTFDQKGLYTATLKVTDGVGEISEKSEVITIESLSETPVAVSPESAPPSDIVEEIPPVIAAPEIIPDEESIIPIWGMVLTIFLLFVLGGVILIVVRTVRRRQEELEEKSPSVPQAPIQAEVVVKEEKKEGPPKKPPAPPSPPAASPPSSPPSPPTPSSGPIPDWLKG